MKAKSHKLIRKPAAIIQAANARLIKDFFNFTKPQIIVLS